MINIIKLGENTVHDDSFEVDRPDGHPVYLLLLIKTTSDFLIDGAWRNINPDMAVIFKPGQRHRYRVNSDSYIDSWMHIDADRLNLGEHFPYGIPIPLHNPEDYYSLFHIIFSEFYGTSPHRGLIINDLTLALLHKIADAGNIRENSRLYYSLTNLREQIYKYPAKSWSVPYMADLLGISPGYLHSVYKQYFNTTCIGDVIQSRIQLACELLISNGLSVERISEICGYNNTEHFIRQFKESMGVTPGKYRRRG